MEMAFLAFSFLAGWLWVNRSHLSVLDLHELQYGKDDSNGVQVQEYCKDGLNECI